MRRKERSRPDWRKKLSAETDFIASDFTPPSAPEKKAIPGLATGGKAIQANMKILHVISSLSPADGGPPEAVRQLVSAFTRAGVKVELLCQDPAGSIFHRGIPCEVHAIPVHALGQRLGRYGVSLRLWRWLHRNAHRFDAIIMHGVWSFPNFAVRRAAGKAGVPYGVFTHGALNPWFNKRYPLKYLKKLLYWPLQYPILRDARAVFFTCDRESEQAKTSFRSNAWNAAVIPYGIGAPEGDPAAQVAAFYAKYPQLAGRRHLLYLGRLHEVKGCDLLIDAWGKTAAIVPEMDLVVAGPDPRGLLAKLRSRAAQLGISQRVHWLGLIEGDLKWGALRAADAFVLPSHHENFGISVVESLAAGRPVLISREVGVCRDIEKNGAGLVESDTLAGIEQLLRRWLTMPVAEREDMAFRAKACFASQFSMDAGARAILDIFQTPKAELASIAAS